MLIIKNKLHKVLIFVVILVLTSTIVIAYTTYSKSKETQAFYTSTYIKAFEQLQLTSDLIENVIENKTNITSQETLSQLNDIHTSLDMSVKDFDLISLRFLSDKPNKNYDFMSELIQLYSVEINNLKSQLLKNNSKDDFDDIKDVLFIRLALMNSDMQKIINIDTSQISDYTYDQLKQVWVKMVNTLEYMEVTKVYKLKYSSLFVKGYFFPYKKK